MVVPLGPGKFYGSTLPRPRIYTDVRHSAERVDPPVPVMDPFLSWAHEAHWSMGGLSFSRLRYQGRIEGNTEKLRKLREKKVKLLDKTSPEKKDLAPDGQKERNKKRGGSVSPPPAPKVTKKRRFLQLIDEEESEEEEDQELEETVKIKRGLARKLVGDFERVAKDNHNVKVADLAKTVLEEVSREEKKSRGGKKGKKSGGESGSEAVIGGIRSSPRLAKQRYCIQVSVIITVPWCCFAATLIADILKLSDYNLPIPYLQTSTMELVIVGSCKELLCPVNIPNSATMDQNFHLEIGLWNPTVSMEDIYSVKTDLWRRLENPPAPHYQAFDSKQRSVFLHGAAHWIVTSEAVFGKCLSVVCLDSSPHSTSGSIWMMKEQVTLLGRQFKFTLAASSGRKLQ
ncbi:hypothetical protein D5086_025003 [Populus alba]|uniref:Uncharacterized protein n=1 Tax=Populus alba TaxID=43335 RepID=A0ACC4B7S9_POPAL